jgi:hypothetical protein
MSKKATLKNEVTALLKSKKNMMTKTAYDKYVIKLFNADHKATYTSMLNDLKHVTGKNTTVQQIRANKKDEAEQTKQYMNLGTMRDYKGTNKFAKQNKQPEEKGNRHMVYDGKEINMTELYKSFKGMEKKKHFQVRDLEKLPVRIVGNPNNVMAFKLKSTDNLKKADVQTIANKVSKILKTSGINGQLATSIMYKKGWRSGYFGEIGQDQVLYNGDDYDGGSGEDQDDEFKRLVFYFYMTKNRGGNSPHNDCLYNCLYQLIDQKQLTFTKPEQLKYYLRLYRDDPVDIALIPRLEARIKIKINVSGDYTYVSNYNSQREINLKLINGHYTIDQAKMKLVYIPSTEKQLLLYDNTLFIAYDGHKEFKLSYDEYISIVRNETQYRIINRVNSKISMEAEYQQTMREIDEIKEASNGEINYYKTYSDKNTALTLFNHLTRTVPKPEQITQLEAQWINEASNSALMFHEVYEGPAYNYDIKSMYPSIMKSRNFLIPIKAGTFEYIEQFENNFVRFGIYRAIIKPSDNTDTNKLFKFVRNNYYTHYDIRRAMDLKLEIELINDGQANALVYHRDKCITGSELFGQYVDKLFDLKQKKVKRAKAILNILWGALSQKDLVKKDVKKSSGNILYIPEDSNIKSIRPSMHDEDTTLVQYVKNDKVYKTNFARICPFLIAKGRSDISKIMEPYKHSVKRVHTDGFILSEEGKEIKIGDELGDLVFEGYNETIEIVNMNKVIVK